MTSKRIISFSALIVAAATLASAQTRLWEAHVLRADSIFKTNPQDTAAILSSLLDSEIEWYTVNTDTGVAKVFNPVGEPLWFEEPTTVINDSLIYRTLEIRRALVGENHPHTARSLERVAMLKARYSKFDEAISIFERALSIYEAALGPNDPELGRPLHCLGFLHRYYYRFDKAEEYLRRSLRVREEGLSPDDPRTSYSMNGLAHLYRNLGRYKDAEVLYRRAYQLRLKAYGPKDPAAVGSMSNILRILTTQGRLVEAEQLASESEGDLAEFSLSYFADLLVEKREFEKAEKIIRDNMLKASEQLGTSDYYYGTLLFKLGTVHYGQGKFKNAESEYRQALSILDNQSNIATSVDLEVVKKHLADLYCKVGRLDEAAILYDEVKKKREEQFGLSHPMLADVLEGRSRCHQLRHNYREALADAEQALIIRRNHYDESFAVLAEHEALTTIKHLRESVSNYFSCFFQYPHVDSLQQARAGDIFFSIKGRVSDGMIRRRQSFLHSADSVNATLINKYMLAKGRLSDLYLRDVARLSTIAYRRQLDSVGLILRELESELAQKNRAFDKSLAHKAVPVAHIATALPQHGTLIEYMKYRRFVSAGEFVDRYIAAVMSPNHQVTLHDLGNAAPIEALIQAYHENMQAVASQRSILSETDRRFALLARKIFQKIWKPLQIEPGTIFVAPDGALNLIAFATLCDDNRSYLIERYSLHYLTSARDLLRDNDYHESGQGLLAIGNPDYNAPASVRASASPILADQKSNGTEHYATRNLRSDCQLLSELNLTPLPGTDREVTAIERLWTTRTRNETCRTFVNRSASEENLKRNIAGKRVIHLATHAYFLEGECGEHKSGSSAAMENPLLRSGLFLAGANLRGSDIKHDDAEDGILTALEVSAMDLRGTELVVLSACETGLGKVEQGEGVYGLRRAFQMAGAKTVVSSLWQVPDDETMKFMKTLYATMAAGQQGSSLTSYPELMRDVALKRIKEARLRGRSTHPFTWGAFVATGEWKIR